MASRGLTARLRGRLAPLGDESVASWSDRVWGRGATKWLIAPALQGIYAASVERLTAAAVFGRDGSRLPSGTRRPALIAPANGMGELIERLVAWLSSRGVTFSFGTPVESLDESTTTIVCTNAREAGRLVRALRADAWRHASIDADDVARLRDGLLLAASSGPSRLWRVVSARFGRERARRALQRRHLPQPVDASIGNVDQRTRRLDNRRATRRSSETCSQIARASPGRKDRAIALVATVWPSALPVYGGAVLDAESQLSELPPWLRIAGNYLGRIGVSRILEGVEDVVGEIRKVARQ